MKFYTRQRRMPTVIIVSLIDILAILLIFVIVTTTFKRSQPEVAIKLPQSRSAGQGGAQSDPIEISVTPDGKILFDAKLVSPKELAVAIKGVQKSTPDRPIALRADEKAPFGVIISVLDVLKEAGIQSSVSAFVETQG